MQISFSQLSCWYIPRKVDLWLYQRYISWLTITVDALRNGDSGLILRTSAFPLGTLAGSTRHLLKSYLL
ncbi:hypothetical protein I7I50_00773 [Histoplasma capsulatum G186AR]|uniref:Uncharacterized protein n=1 Tax=Ajellomyces capsulatus TaxID=5037 RepID=A0A8H7YJ22_AJECA|nr:hypothetical protein I7I52_08041 [Histoplasma capsulatum]QSS72815.1 hypothetical protein I7I50_00773 [Histoplasma capsulatum G186AR]